MKLCFWGTWAHVVSSCTFPRALRCSWRPQTLLGAFQDRFWTSGVTGIVMNIQKPGRTCVVTNIPISIVITPVGILSGYNHNWSACTLPESRHKKVFFFFDEMTYFPESC